MSLGKGSIILYVLLFISNAFKCSHRIVPVVVVLSSNFTWSGKSLIVLVTGQTIVKFVFLVKRYKFASNLK